MKDFIKVLGAITFLFVSAGYALQSPQEELPKQKPLTVKDSEIPKKFLDSLAAARVVFDTELRKVDSLLIERTISMGKMQRNLTELKEANRMQKSAINRLVFILKHFPVDSVLKFDSEFKEIPVREDSVKKKIEREVVPVKPHKKNIFQRFWSIFKRK